MPKNPHHPVQALGKRLSAIAWIIALLLLTWLFGSWEKVRFNPNASPKSVQGEQMTQVTLLRNRYHHYVTSGTINNKEVVFLLDTGATDVVIPADIARDLNLHRGQRQTALTANGRVDVYTTIIDELRIGAIRLHNVDASINPGMNDQAILLGMSALKDIEFTQRGDALTLRQYR
ncbi:MAG: retroviral-like aspartic protease family protein [Cellvibrionaceae bacterium]|nr:retroviral-like aspartic protease family protein [Cellvibrionaceae bacterium]